MSQHPIYVDDEVWAEIKKRANPLKDTPNKVLRRVLLPGEMNREILTGENICPECGDGIAKAVSDGYIQCTCCGARWNDRGERVAVGDVLCIDYVRLL